MNVSHGVASAVVGEPGTYAWRDVHDCALPVVRREPSRRRFPARVPPSAYPAHYLVRYAIGNGGIRFNRACVTLATALIREHVRLEECWQMA